MKKREMQIRKLALAPAMITGALCVLLAATPALAEQIHISGEPCPLPVDGAEIPLTEFEVLGVVEDSVVIRYQSSAEPAEESGEWTEEGAQENGGEQNLRTGYVSVEAINSLLPQLDLESLPDASGMGTVTYGSDQNNVAILQQYLIGLGYLEGEPDGMYGPGTAGALSSFQADKGLQPTGEGDAETVLTLLGTAEGTYDQSLELTYPAQLTTEEKFAPIIANVSKNLDAFTDSSWRFIYDKYEKNGWIDPGIATGTYTIEAPDMEKIQLNTSLKVRVTTTKNGTVNLTPALAVESNGAYRPYVQSALFSQGNTVIENTKGFSIGALDGAMVKEVAYVPLTLDTLDLFAGSSELDVRISGKNTKYDMHFSADRERLAVFTEAARGLLSE